MLYAQKSYSITIKLPTSGIAPRKHDMACTREMQNTRCCKDSVKKTYRKENVNKIGMICNCT